MVSSLLAKGAALLSAVLLLSAPSAQTAGYQPVPIADPLVNPMAGFAPSADYPAIVGDNTLVYVEVTWREWEPEKGVYDTASLEKKNNLAAWRAQGKRVVFRFLCDDPGDEPHVDIPDWLYEETGHDGDWYDTDYGQGFSPNYANPRLIERHRAAIEALGKRYGGDDFFCFVELGSLGHWGEWHTKYEDGLLRMPVSAVREQYIAPYRKAFPRALLLMRRPFAPAKQYGMGLFNDMTGYPQATEEWLGWIQRGGIYGDTGERNALVSMPDFWKTAPSGGEFTSSLSMEDMMGGNLARTKSLIARSHMSFVGPMCPCTKEDLTTYPDAVAQVRALLGYRLRIAQAAVSRVVLPLATVRVRLDWVNDGIAPMYRNWDAYLYVLDGSGATALRQKIGIDLRKITGKSPVSTTTYLSLGKLPAGTYNIGVAIIDPLTKQPGIAFAMKNSRSDRIYVLGQWTKQ